MIGAIILAAGRSKRFGDDKRRAELPGGKMVIEQTIQNTLLAFDEVIVTLRADDKSFASELKRRVASDKLTFYLAPDSARGMGHSLANAITQITHWTGVFICLADMPFTSPTTLLKLKSAMKNEGTIVTPFYENERGQPSGFGRKYFSVMSQLSGDQGARAILQANNESIVRVDVTDSGVITDIDRPSDLAP